MSALCLLFYSETVLAWQLWLEFICSCSHDILNECDGNIFSHAQFKVIMPIIILGWFQNVLK